MLLDFITCTIVCEEYRSWSSFLCTLLHSPPHTRSRITIIVQYCGIKYKRTNN
jgi:hypothetical protein